MIELTQEDLKIILRGIAMVVDDINQKASYCPHCQECHDERNIAIEPVGLLEQKIREFTFSPSTDGGAVLKEK